jgi:hypothetical protein
LRLPFEVCDCPVDGPICLGLPLVKTSDASCGKRMAETWRRHNRCARGLPLSGKFQGLGYAKPGNLLSLPRGEKSMRRGPCPFET